MKLSPILCLTILMVNSGVSNAMFPDGPIDAARDFITVPIKMIEMFFKHWFELENVRDDILPPNQSILGLRSKEIGKNDEKCLKSANPKTSDEIIVKDDSKNSFSEKVPSLNELYYTVHKKPSRYPVNSNTNGSEKAESNINKPTKSSPARNLSPLPCPKNSPSFLKPNENQSQIEINKCRLPLRPSKPKSQAQIQNIRSCKRSEEKGVENKTSKHLNEQHKDTIPCFKTDKIGTLLDPRIGYNGMQEPCVYSQESIELKSMDSEKPCLYPQSKKNREKSSDSPLTKYLAEESIGSSQPENGIDEVDCKLQQQTDDFKASKAKYDIPCTYSIHELNKNPVHHSQISQDVPIKLTTPKNSSSCVSSQKKKNKCQSTSNRFTSLYSLIKQIQELLSDINCDNEQVHGRVRESFLDKPCISNEPMHRRNVDLDGKDDLDETGDKDTDSEEECVEYGEELSDADVSTIQTETDDCCDITLLTRISPKFSHFDNGPCFPKSEEDLEESIHVVQDENESDEEQLTFNRTQTKN